MEVWKQFTTSISRSSAMSGCLSSIHYGSLKAIHNLAKVPASELRVFILYPLWKFESNSQLYDIFDKGLRRCLSSIHYGSLKAIHNIEIGVVTALSGVYPLSIMEVWKQFTTDCHMLSPNQMVFFLYLLWMKKEDFIIEK